MMFFMEKLGTDKNSVKKSGKRYLIPIMALCFSVSLGTQAMAADSGGAFPRPEPRRIPAELQNSGAQGQAAPASPANAAPDTESARTIEELRRQFPNLPISSDSTQVVQIVTQGEPSAGNAPDPYQVAGEEEFYEDGEYDENIEFPEQLMKDLQDSQLAQHWLDVQEDLKLRDIDNKALGLVKEFAAAQHAVPPTPGLNGAVSYNFGDHIPKIICRPNRVTSITLQPGEKVTAVHAGDTTRWQFNPAISGSGANETVHVIVKPLVPDISTNLMVMTDRRTYNVDLVSSSTNFIPSARFSYPEDTLQSWGAFISANRKESGDELLLAQGASISPENLYFGYTIVRGKSVSWKPTNIFDDGTKTYIELPAKYKSMEAPILLFYEGKRQKMVNYRVKDRLYIVDRIMSSKAVLIAGQTRVVIQRVKEKN